MTKNKVLYAWFNEFMKFYRDTSVPVDAAMPYGTYSYTETAFPNEQVNIVVNLWYRTESEALPDADAQALSEKIGYGGVLLECDEGYLWLKRGSPWCNSLTDEEDPAIKKRYINITAEYLTFS